MKNKGFTLLFTVLITSIILAIALGISRISYTENLLSSVAREGGRAFFAADTGLECGLYQDLEEITFIPPAAVSFKCAGETVPALVEQPIVPSFPEASERFEFEINLPGKNACARVNVYKSWIVNQETYTRVESFGYNRNCQVVEDTLTGSGAQDPKLVERALRATYKNNIQLQTP